MLNCRAVHLLAECLFSGIVALSAGVAPVPSWLFHAAHLGFSLRLSTALTDDCYSIYLNLEQLTSQTHCVLFISAFYKH